MKTDYPYRHYFWTGVAVQPMKTGELTADTIGWCVDTKYTAAFNRYGKYNSFQWEHIPLEDFPAEFRMHLLLLGVI